MPTVSHHRRLLSLYYANLISAVEGSVQGFVEEHLVVPVESVNRVAVAVRFQPEPEPVASTNCIRSSVAMVRFRPLRGAAAHLIVPDVAPTDSVPPVTVAVPEMVH